MAQSPFLVDALQIEPGSGDTLTIARKASGELVFVDGELSSGTTLTELAGLRTVPQVLVVGQSGAGAQYNAIQDAIDAVPVTASSSDPYLVLVLPGVYDEQLIIEVDGLSLLGLGSPTITSATGNVVTVQETVSVTPKSFQIQGFRIVAQEGAASCVFATGGQGSEVLEEGAVIVDCDLVSAGAGGYALKASGLNTIVATGGDWGQGQLTTSVRVANCASIKLIGQVRLPSLQMDYDPTADVPSTVTSEYLVRGASLVGDIQSTMNTRGSLTLQHCGTVGDVVINGDRSFEASYCKVGDVTANETSAISLMKSSSCISAGAGTFARYLSRGVADFVAVDEVVVTFDVDMPDSDFTVALEVDVNALAIVTNKSAAGFKVSFPAGAQNASVGWIVLRGE